MSPSQSSYLSLFPPTSDAPSPVPSLSVSSPSYDCESITDASEYLFSTSCDIQSALTDAFETTCINSVCNSSTASFIDGCTLTANHEREFSDIGSKLDVDTASPQSHQVQSQQFVTKCTDFFTDMTFNSVPITCTTMTMPNDTSATQQPSFEFPAFAPAAELGLTTPSTTSSPTHPSPTRTTYLSIPTTKTTSKHSRRTSTSSILSSTSTLSLDIDMPPSPDFQPTPTLPTTTTHLPPHPPTNDRATHTRTHICPYYPTCPKAYTRRFNLTSHILSTHTNTRPFPCPHCPSDQQLRFARKHDLNRHIASVHEEAPHKYRCLEEGCGMTFARSDALKRHLEVEGRKRFGVGVGYGDVGGGKVEVRVGGEVYGEEDLERLFES
ncbi:hypothetical protein HDV00_001499 [Rhizophlyctis rosea]|nr:hypothetical protein HDV00_001499 [Rhizophlyctis rosea]